MGDREGQQQSKGILYVVSTPIGNLADVTMRALAVLKEVDVIAAENVTHTRGLCRHHGIRAQVVSCNQHNQRQRVPELIKRLTAGSDVALVTDAGTPGISDPGVYLIKKAADEGIRVSPIPGPSAVIAALSVSGFPTEQFVFIGFLPSKAGKRRRELAKLTGEQRTMVFFEAPHRLRAALEDMREALGDRPMVLVRELTKVFEEVRRGSVGEIREGLVPEKIKGEFTLVVAGSDKKETALELEGPVKARIESLLLEGKGSVRDIATRVSEEEGIPYREIYRACLERKKALKAGSPETKLVREFTISNKLGLHARAAARIVALGNEYTSRLYLKKEDKEVDGSSILSILTLSCPRGTRIQARVEGKDAEQFMDKLGQLFEQQFGEGT